jgi:ABC-2 type transport system ATP-binding protein
MNAPLVTNHLNKSFEGRPALHELTLAIPTGRVAGLLGRNGSGKTTLLNLACGLLLPTAGTCVTLGRASRDLGAPELSRLGVVFQEGRFLDWMTVQQHLEFTASFYPVWDHERESRLLAELELDANRRIVQLSPGDRQKFGLVLAVCHHPALLLLDEPMSALDPIARARLLAFLIDLVREDGCTIVISSHILADVEKIIDWVVCLDRGDLAVSAPFDEVQENYAEWIVTSAAGRLPARFSEPWVLAQTGDARQARLSVRRPGADPTARFATTHQVEIETRPLNLEQLFPLLVNERRPAA